MFNNNWLDETFFYIWVFDNSTSPLLRGTEDSYILH